MTVILVMFYVMIALTTLVRLSLMSIKIWLAIVALWGLVAMVITYCISGLTPAEISNLLNMRNVVIGEFIELLIFITWLFSSGGKSRILGIYPGVMICVPIAFLSASSYRVFPGMDFTVIAILTGVSVYVAMIGFIFLCRYFRLHKESLYEISLLNVLVCVSTFGLS